MKKIYVLLLLFLCANSGLMSGSDLAASAKKKIPETTIIFKSIVEDKEEYLTKLQKDKEALESEKDALFKSIKTELEETQSQTNELEKKIAQEPDDEYLNKTLSQVAATRDVLNDIQRMWEGLIKKVADNIAILEKFLKDPEFREYRKDLKIASGPYFFEDLENIHQKIISELQFFDQLKKRKESATKEQKNLQQVSDKLNDEYADRKTKIEDFGKAARESQTLVAPLGMNIKQQADLLNIEVNLARLKKDLADVQLREKKAEIAGIDTELFLESMHLEILQEVQRKIKSAITVTHEQLDLAHRELEKKKQLFSSLKTRYHDEINQIRKMREDQSARLTQMSQKYGISLGNELNTWSVEPQKTKESYLRLCQVGELNTHVLVLDAREAYLEALIALEQEKINYAQEISNIKESYYKIAAHKFAAEEDIGIEIRLYNEKRTGVESTLKSIRAKKDEVETSFVKLQNEVLGRIKKFRTEIQQQREQVFKNNMNDYAQCLSLVDKSEEYVAQQMDSMTGAGKAYTEIIGLLEKLSGHVRFIITELESITIWYRPEHAISWAGLMHVFKDVKHFFADLRAYYMQLGFGAIVTRTKELSKHPWPFVSLLFKLLCVLLFTWLLRRFAYILILPLRQLCQQTNNIYPWALLTTFFVEFLLFHSLGLSFWIGGFLILKYYFLADPYLYAVFYLVSIPYWLYLSNRFLLLFRQLNIENKYYFIAQESAKHFLTILMVLINATIVLMLFREAFILIKIPKSELPKILLALNFVVIQVCFVLLITKNVVLWLIPTRFDIGHTIYQWVDRYYYVLIGLIVTIFVLSNPYIGYGRLVAYFAVGLFYSIVLIAILLWLHGLIKQGASLLFFETKDDVVKERFSYAKTFFGASLIASFLVLTVIGFLIAAKIWGWPLTIQDVIKWLNQPLFGIGKGTANPLTFITIGTITLFVLIGFVVAFGFNRFVLDKVFDLMLVDPGVQHAFTNMVRYLIVIAAILLGLQSVGYGGIITYFYVLILGIGYLIQNPLNDLFAYFILLIQRPINIGDYIRIDDEIIGVVRKITPKSVVIRKKNSTTIVVPNSMITTKPVYNWNYSSNFIAFDDIRITVAYKEDPEKVKALLLRAVESHSKILKNPRPVIRLDNFTELGYEFMVRGFLSPNYTLEQLDVASDVRLAIIKSLRQEGIEIAVPMRVMLNTHDRTEN